MTQKPLLWVDVGAHAVRMRCACGAQKVIVCWGGVSRRGCRVALACALSLKPFWAVWRLASSAFFVWCSPVLVLLISEWVPHLP